MIVNTIGGKKQSHKWTFEDAKSWLHFSPNDKSIQFIIRQLDLKHRTQQYGGLSQEQIRNSMLRESSRQRAQGVDMFSMLSGRMAVQECLQMDASLQAADAGADSNGRHFALADLEGPSAKSHPWSEMLGSARPVISELSKNIPSDFFLIEGKSAASMLEILLNANSFAQIFHNQAQKESIDLAVLGRYRNQLQLDDRFLEATGKASLLEIAVCGSDLYLKEGADVCVLFKFADQFAEEATGILARTERATLRAERGHELVEAVADDGTHTYACNLTPFIHVRSNSIESIRQVLLASCGEKASLGQSDEFAYIRTLMKSEQEKEDVFVYLSDPFIRKLIGPELRIAQHRRAVCANKLELIDHAILIYCTEIGRLPESLDDILRSGLCPELTVNSSCVDGGRYNLECSSAAEGNSIGSVWARCALHGSQKFLTPNLHSCIDYADAAEAAEYKQFVSAYNQYWVNFFDPIGIQIQSKDNRYVARTIVLPLINNSAYSTLFSVIGGSEAEDLSASNLPPETIMSLRAKLNKESLNQYSVLLNALFRYDAHSSRDLREMFHSLVNESLGDQIGFHIWDAEPTFSLDISALLGLAALGGRNTRALAASGQFLFIGGLLASLNRPVFASFSVKNPMLLDQLLDEMESVLSKVDSSGRGFVGFDYSRLQAHPELIIHSCSWQLGPAKFRLFVARIEDEFYMSTQKSVIESLYEFRRASRDKTGSNSSSTKGDCMAAKSQAIFEINHEHWHKVQSDADLLWLDNNRKACLKNLAPLTVLARSVAGLRHNGDLLPGDILHAASLCSSVAAKAFCPDGGVYTFDSSSGNVYCTVHGGRGQSRQSVNLSESSNASTALLRSLKRSYAQLTFLEDGLHGELVVERKN